MTKGSQKTIDCVFIFDTTGSMSPCIHQVRKNIKETCLYLYEQIPNLRIGILSHGDWCDGSQVISTLELTSVRDHEKLERWIDKNPDTYGGDAPECYEYALHIARKDFDWNADIKFGVMVGDDVPHSVKDYNYRGRYGAYKNAFGGESTCAYWQLDSFVSQIGPLFPIQALGHRYDGNDFWQKMADIQGNVPKLDLEQFSDIHQILMAVCMQQAGRLTEYENSIVSGPRVSHNVISTIDLLAGRKKRARKTTSHSKHAVMPSRFQALRVSTNTPIKDFVEDNHLSFNVGRGFYEFTKRVKVQDYKEVIIRDNYTGDMFSGDKAREILGIPIGETCNVSPTPGDKYTGFIQSTSNNRKLLVGTEFLYEVSDE